MKLLFDCDGTILDSMHIWSEPINGIFEKYGFSFEGLDKEEKGKIEAYITYGPIMDLDLENMNLGDEINENDQVKGSVKLAKPKFQNYENFKIDPKRFVIYNNEEIIFESHISCLLYTSPSPRDV